MKHVLGAYSDHVLFPFSGIDNTLDFSLTNYVHPSLMVASSLLDNKYA